ncbi:hypothetical protein Pst134EA_007807 [Puccinia striiformis f. sp. tritici]|uniref:hypothetical protein n=2 Tax=Puccinia striiformis f. sp. tritici TaxID=168172 RepID=UPI0020086285|nr:hypothetical protein Pst134EA_007807 [Puccinia striiformis f. sp. tritici]KAH9470560.1 hypothetical protein Pst134EA_007807 [Puccinia striiformis f. sp. tritici]
MDHSLASSLDALKVYPSHKDVPDDQLVPSLVYSGSRNRTMTVLEVIDRARETPDGAHIPNSSCARRFHSCTGDEDKVTCVEEFASGQFPVISCTMALGLGQNWKRVRMVAHMGRGDPASICQMIGRCGRDGKQGLAILFMEKTRRGGKNHVDQFTRGVTQTDVDRMDALAITHLCLRVAFSLDNIVGYIPLWDDDPFYIKEVQREKSAGMPACRCSNCAPEAAQTLLKCLSIASKENFDNIMDDQLAPPENYNLKHKFPSKRPAVKKRKFTEKDAPEVKEFSRVLCEDLYNHYNNNISPGGSISASDLFDLDDCSAILAHLDNINEPRYLRRLIGGDSFAGQIEWLYKWITIFKASRAANQPVISNSPSAPNKAKGNPILPTESIKRPTVPKKTSKIPRQPGALTKKGRERQERERVAREKKLEKDETERIKQARKDQLTGMRAASWEAHRLEKALAAADTSVTGTGARGSR